MTTETNHVDQHIAKLRMELALIAGEQGIAHIPSQRWLVRSGLTQRQAFERAMKFFEDGRDAGLVMNDPLPPQLATLGRKEYAALSPAAREYIEMLERLLADAEKT